MRNAVNPIGRLHVLTDFHLQQRFSHAEIARLAIAGGADTIQFRQKAGAIRHRLHEAEQTADVCRAAGCTLLIDDDVALALATAAAGVHVGQADLPVAVVRRILGPQAIVGATATYAWQAVEAWKQGADYIGFGPVFPTRSKANPASVKGLDGLRATCEAVPIPVIAIAGLTPERVAPVLEAGAHGIAVLSAITNAPDPEAATRRFREAIDAVLEARS